MTANTITFAGLRSWKHNYEIIQVIDGGQKLKVAGWCRTSIKDGDFLILESKRGETRYRVESIKYEHNPADMFFADLLFSPREQAQGDAQ